MNENEFFIKDYWIISLCILIPFFRVLKFLPSIPVPIYYGIFGLVAFLLLLHKTYRMCWQMALFMCICLLSIIGNTIPAYFHSEERFIGMLLLLLCVGPLVSSEWLGFIRKKILIKTSYCMMIISVISFVLYVVYRPFTITERGHLFGGITNHSMTMGPIAAISALFVLQYKLFGQEKLLGKQRTIYWGTFIVSIFCVLLAGSRSALLSLFCAIVAWAWIYFNNIKKLIGYSLLTLFIVAVSFPIWWNYTETIQMKMAYAERQGNVVASRATKWQGRIAEFYERPFLGYGFCSIKLNDATVSDNYQGTIEPANGWLFVLSSTGMFSFIVFVVFYVQLLHKLFKIRGQLSVYLITLMVFFLFHMMAEGYITSSGNYLFFIFWLTLGVGLCHVNYRIEEANEYHFLAK